MYNIVIWCGVFFFLVFGLHSEACEIPKPGIESVPPAVEAWVITTGRPGSWCFCRLHSVLSIPCRVVIEYWLYSLCCTLHPCNLFIPSSLYLLIPFIYFAHPPSDNIQYLTFSVLTSFTEHNALQVYPCCHKWQNSVLFYGWVILQSVCTCVYTVSLSKQYAFLNENIFSWLLPVDLDKKQLKEKVTLIINSCHLLKSWGMSLVAFNPGTSFLVFFSASYWWDHHLRVVKKSAHDLTAKCGGLRT